MRLILFITGFVLFFFNAKSQDKTFNPGDDLSLINYLDILKKQNDSLNLDIPSNSRILKEVEESKCFLLNGDTVSGKIEILNMGNDERDFGKFNGDHSFNPNISFALMPIKIKFYDNKGDGSEKKLRADKIKGFEKGNKFYYSKKTADLPPFYIERIIDGKINLYSYRYHCKNSQNRIHSSNNNLSSIDYVKDYYVEGDGNSIIKLDCSNIDKFIQNNFADHHDYRQNTRLYITNSIRNDYLSFMAKKCYFFYCVFWSILNIENN